MSCLICSPLVWEGPLSGGGASLAVMRLDVVSLEAPVATTVSGSSLVLELQAFLKK